MDDVFGDMRKLLREEAVKRGVILEKPKRSDRDQAVIDAQLGKSFGEQVVDVVTRPTALGELISGVKPTPMQQEFAELQGQVILDRRKQQRDYAEKADPVMRKKTEDILKYITNSSNRFGATEALNALPPEEQEEVMRLAPGVMQQLGDDRGNAAWRALNAAWKGINDIAVNPLAELTGLSGSPQDVERARYLEGLRQQEAAPTRGDDPWWVQGSLGAIEQAPYAIGTSRLATLGGNTLKALGASAGVSSAIGQTGGTIAATFPSAYINSYHGLKDMGMEDGLALRGTAAAMAFTAGAIERIDPKILPEIPGGKINMTQGVGKALGQQLFEAAKKFPKELAEEGAQAFTDEMAKVAVSWANDNIKDMDARDAFIAGLDGLDEALLPTLFMTGVPAGASAALSARQVAKQTRAFEQQIGDATPEDMAGVQRELQGLKDAKAKAPERIKELSELASKGFVSKEDADTFGIGGETRKERIKNVYSELDRLNNTDTDGQIEYLQSMLDRWEEAGNQIPERVEDEVPDQTQSQSQETEVPNDEGQVEGDLQEVNPFDELRANMEAIRQERAASEPEATGQTTPVAEEQAPADAAPAMEDIKEDVKTRLARQRAEREKAKAGVAPEVPGTSTAQPSPSDINSIVKATQTEPIGRGGNASVYGLDDTQVVRVPKDVKDIADDFKPVDHPLTKLGIRAGQAIAENSQGVGILQRQVGEEAGLAMPKLVPEGERDNLYSSRVKKAAEMPQSAYDDLAETITKINNAGYRIDPSKSSNILIDSEGGKFNLVDVNGGSDVAPGKDGANALLVMLMGNTYFSNYKGQPLTNEYRSIYDKVMSAAKKHGMSEELTSSGMWSREKAGLGSGTEQPAQESQPVEPVATEEEKALRRAAAQETADWKKRTRRAGGRQAKNEFSDLNAAVKSALKTINLKVSDDLSPKAIQRAFRKAAATAHPDSGGSVEQMAALNEAVELLSSVPASLELAKRNWEKKKTGTQSQPVVDQQAKPRPTAEKVAPEAKADEPVPQAQEPEAKAAEPTMTPEQEMAQGMEKLFREAMAEADQKEQSSPDKPKTPRKRTGRKDNKPPKSSLQEAADKANAEADRLAKEMMDLVRNSAQSGFNPKIGLLAARFAVARIKGGALTFAAFAERAIKDFPGDFLKVLSPYLEAAWNQARVDGYTTDPAGKISDYVTKPETKKPASEKTEQPPKPSPPKPEKESESSVLSRFKITANRFNGNIYLQGKTYAWKEKIKEIGQGKASQYRGGFAWRLTPQGYESLLEELRGLSVPNVGAGGSVADNVSNPDLRRLRADIDGRSDSRKPGDALAELSSVETKELLARGLKAGMPQSIVDEQIEDAGMIIDAREKGESLFLLANEPGSGKTFVLGAAIRELKARGAEQITYVTLNTDLIGQIKNDLADYGIDDVKFVTYSDIRDTNKSRPQFSDVLIFDEAHSIKNTKSDQGKAAARWIERSDFTIFASATPFENPVQAKYLDKTNVFDEFGGFQRFALAFGARSRMVGDELFVYWERTDASDDDATAARDYIAKRGLMTTRRIRLPEGQVDSRMVKINASDANADQYAALSKAAADNDKKLHGFGKAYIINLQKRLLEASKIDQAIKEAESAIDRGRFPIVFVETKADRKIDIPDLVRKQREYDFAVAAAMRANDTRPKRSDFGLPPAGVVEVFEAFMQSTGQSEIVILSAEDIFRNHFGEDRVAIFTGSVTPAKAQKALKDWRSGKRPVIVSTMAKGGTGLSLHDKVGNHQTTQINVNLPWTATQVVQVAQRSARYGLVGKAELLWLFADNIPFDQQLAGRVGGRMADMGAVVHGQSVAEASQLQDWDFESDLFSEETSEVEGPASDKPLTPSEQADKAAEILSDIEANQAKMREDKKLREGEKLANWLKAFVGSPRETTAAKDLYRKDFEKAQQNGVSDDRLIEIIDHGAANGMFSAQEASDLKRRVKPATVEQPQGLPVEGKPAELEALLARAEQYRKGKSRDRGIASTAIRLEIAIKNERPAYTIQGLMDELKSRLDQLESDAIAEPIMLSENMIAAGLEIKKTKKGWSVKGLPEEIGYGLTKELGGRKYGEWFSFRRDPLEAIEEAARAIIAENLEIAAAEASGNVRTRIGTMPPEMANEYERARAERIEVYLEPILRRNEGIQELLGNYLKTGLKQRAQNTVRRGGDLDAIEGFDSLVQAIRDENLYGLPTDPSELLELLANENWKTDLDAARREIAERVDSELLNEYDEIQKEWLEQNDLSWDEYADTIQTIEEELDQERERLDRIHAESLSKPPIVEEAVSTDLFGNEIKTPKPKVKGKEFESADLTQKTLFSTEGAPGQMNLFPDDGVPDDMVAKPNTDPDTLFQIGNEEDFVGVAVELSLDAEDAGITSYDEFMEFATKAIKDTRRAWLLGPYLQAAAEEIGMEGVRSFKDVLTEPTVTRDHVSTAFHAGWSKVFDDKEKYDAALEILNAIQLDQLPGGGVGFVPEGTPVPDGRMAQEQSPQTNAPVSDREAVDEASLLNAIIRGNVPGASVSVARKLGAYEAAKQAGYDGIVYRNLIEDAGKDSYVAFDPTQIKSATGNRGTFDPSNPSILYQQGQRLSVLHNLSADNLIFASNMGGLAAPSLAVVKDDMGLEGFGEITLIGREDLADPAAVEVHDADAYTSRFPQPEYKSAKSNVAQKLVDDLKPWRDKFNDQMTYSEVWDNAVNNPRPQETVRRFLYGNSTKAWFLHENGIDVNPVMESVGPRWGWDHSPAWVAFVKNTNHDVNNLGWDDPVRIQYHKDAGDAARRAMIESAESYRKAGVTQEYIDEIVAGGVSNFIDDDGALGYGYLDAAIRSAKNRGTKKVDQYATQKLLDKRLKGLEEKFKSWVESKVLPMYGDPFIKLNGKRVAYTLDNIVEAMTRGGAHAKEKTMSFGEGMARAVAAQKIQSIQEMKNRAGGITSKGDVDAAREEAKKALSEWRDKVIKYYDGSTWDGLDASMRAIAKWAKGRQLSDALRSEGFRDAPKDVVAEGVTAGKLFMEAPVPYFEAKPPRVVSLNEFAGAVIPSNASDKVKEILESNGIPFSTYPSKTGDPARVKAVKKLRDKLAKQGEKVLFQNQNDPNGNVKGWTKFISATRAIIGATDKADFSTFIHELFHPMRRFLLDRSIPLDKRQGITDEDLQALEDYAGVKDGNWTVAAEEKAAKAWEQYWLEGKSPTTALQALFEKVARWMRGIYQGIQQITGNQLTPEVRALFDKIVQRGFPDGFQTPPPHQGPGAPPVDSESHPEKLQRIFPNRYDFTAMGKGVMNYLRELEGIPGLETLTKETVEGWVQQAEITLAADPYAAERLYRDVAASDGRPLDQHEVTLLAFHYRRLANDADRALTETIEAAKSNDPVRIAQARTEFIRTRQPMTEFEEVTYASKSAMGRAFYALQVMLRQDFSRAGLMKRAQSHNHGKPLSEAQKDEMDALAKQIKELQDEVDRLRNKYEREEAETESKKQHDDVTKDAPPPRPPVDTNPPKGSAQAEKNKSVLGRLRSFLDQIAESTGFNTLFQMDDPYVGAVAAYRELGVTTFAELNRHIQERFGMEAAAKMKRDFRAAWKQTKPDSDIDIAGVFDIGDSREMTRLARAIQRDLVEGGFRDRVEIIELVRDEMSQQLEKDVTTLQAMDWLSGYGQFTTPSKEPIEAILRKLNTENLKHRQIIQLGDALARVEQLRAQFRTEDPDLTDEQIDRRVGDQLVAEGMLVKPTGPQRDKDLAQDIDIRALQREYNDLKSQIPVSTENREGMLQTRMGSVQRALANRIADIKEALATGKPINNERRAPLTNPEIEDLRAQLAEAVKEYREAFPKKPMSEAQRIKNAIKAAERSILAMDKQIKTRNFDKPKSMKVSSPELDALEAQKTAMRAQIDALKALELSQWESEGGALADNSYKQEAAVRKNYIASIERRIAEYERVIAEKDFKKKIKIKRELTDEELKAQNRLREAKRKALEAMAQYHLDNLTGIEKAWDYASEFMHLSRAVMTSMDMSALGNQGALTALSRPIRSAKILKEIAAVLQSQMDTSKIFSKEKYTSIEDFFTGIDSQQAEFNYMEKLRSGKWGEMKIKAGLALLGSEQEITKQEEVFQGRWGKYVPGVALSSRVYTMMLNGLRSALFDAMAEGHFVEGKMTLEEAKLLASFVNITTGRSDLAGMPGVGQYLKRLETNSAILNTVFFAPRFVAARFQYLAMPFYLPFAGGGVSKAWNIKKQIYTEMGRTVGSYMMVLFAVSLLSEMFWDDEDEDRPTIGLDPTTSDFGKVKIGDTRIDFGGGILQSMVFLSRLGLGRRGDQVFGEGFKPMTRAELIKDYIRTKMAPIPGYFWTAADDWKDPVGQVKDEILGYKVHPVVGTGVRLFIPLTLQNMVEVTYEHGVAGLPLAAMSFLGVRIGTYGPKTKYAYSTTDERSKQLDTFIKKMTWESPDPEFHEFLSADEYEQVQARRENRKQSLVNDALDDPKADSFQDPEDYAKAVAKRDAAIEAIRSAGWNSTEIRQLLLDHWKSNHSSPRRLQGGVYVLKDQVKERLRRINKVFGGLNAND